MAEGANNNASMIERAVEFLRKKREKKKTDKVQGIRDLDADIKKAQTESKEKGGGEAEAGAAALRALRQRRR